MKTLPLVVLLSAMLGIFSCKKEAGIEEPVPLPDFSGLYKLQGNLELQSNPVSVIPINWVVTDEDGGKFKVGLPGGYNSVGYRWVTSGIYSFLPGGGQFRVIFNGGATQATGSATDYWTTAELDSIFQPGKQLFYGIAFGQVQIELQAVSGLGGEYWSQFADNSDFRLTIETVNDMETYFPQRKWVKQVTVRFDARLKHMFSNSSDPKLLMKDFRASLLLEPLVE